MPYWAPYGRHPVDVGDLIRNRYRILHLLGEGTFSMVWLAEDMQPTPTSNHGRLVSLKIAVAQVTEGEPDQLTPEQLNLIQRESEVLKHIRSMKKMVSPGSEYPSYFAEGSRFVIDLLDDFILKGPNGLHQCLVLEFCAPSVGYIRQGVRSWGFAPTLSQKLAIQLTAGVAFLQGCNVGHGDLHAGNLLLYSTRFRTWGPEDVLKHLGPAVKLQPQITNPGPPHGPKAEYHASTVFFWPILLGLNDKNAEYPDIELRITDFGESFISQPPPMPRYMGIPPVIASPEVLFRKALIHSCVRYTWGEETEDEENTTVESLSDSKSSSRSESPVHVTSPSEPESSVYATSPPATIVYPAPSEEFIMDPLHNSLLRLLNLPVSSPFLHVTPLSDLWSLGTAIFEMFEHRGSLFGEHSEFMFGFGPPSAEFVLLELGVTFQDSVLQKIRQERRFHRDKELDPVNKPLGQRLEESTIMEHHDNLAGAIFSLLKLLPNERATALKTLALLEETWPLHRIGRQTAPSDTISEAGQSEVVLHSTSGGLN